MLQWGHGVEAVEEARPVQNADSGLQWGHGVEAVEERYMSEPMLQWGHGDEAVEEHGT